MNKILFFTLFLQRFLVAEEKYSKIFFDFEFLGKTKVFIDCNYNNKKTLTQNIYNYEKFVNDNSLNKTFYEYCKNNDDFIIDDLDNFKKKYLSNTSSKSNVDIYRHKIYLQTDDGKPFNNNTFNESIKKINVIVKNSNNSSVNSFAVNSIPIYSIEKAILKYETFFNNSFLNKDTINLNIEDFEFDINDKVFKKLTFDKNFSLSPILYTNNYVINKNSKCIDGVIVQNKKTKNTLIDDTKTCDFIVKKNTKIK